MSSLSRSRKGMDWHFILGAVIFIIILAITWTFLGKGAQNFQKGTGCSSAGGILAHNCNPDVSIPLPAQNDEKTGYVCCLRKPGVDKDKFNAWAQEIGAQLPFNGTKPEVQNETTENIDDSKPSNIDVLNTENPVVYTNPDITTVSTTSLVSNKPYFRIRGKLVPEQTLTPIPVGVSTIEATNTYGDYDKCVLNVREKSGTTLQPALPVEVIATPCPKGTRLRYSYDFAASPNKYQLQLIMYESSKQKASGIAWVQTNVANADDESTTESGKKLVPLVERVTTQPIYREGEKFVFIAPSLPQPSDYPDVMTLVGVTRTGSCEGITFVESTADESFYRLDDDSQLCVFFATRETETYEGTKTRTYLFSTQNTDNVFVLSQSKYALYFDDPCTLTCEDLSRSVCKDYTKRTEGCMYKLSCHWSEADDTHSGRYCKACAGTTCSQMTLQAGCERNECSPNNCEWDEALFITGQRGSCVQPE